MEKENLFDPHEVFGGISVHPNLVCRSCYFSLPTTKETGDGAEKSICGIYGDVFKGRTKPNTVYFDGSDCDYYEPREDE
jgi:hypothetical protein